MISRVSISDFRSIRKIDLNIEGLFVPIIGVNNTGKSNILRALNLFFNNKTDIDEGLELRTDFHKPERKKRKVIKVEVEFNLPQSFNYRKSFRDQLESILGKHFSIAKEWSIPEKGSEEESGLKYFFKKISSENDVSEKEADSKGRTSNNLVPLLNTF